MTNPWDQQAKESTKAFSAFISYRDLGLRRSCQKVADALKKNLSSILELSKRHNWQKRVTAWDAYLDKQSQANQIEAVKAMKSRQINLALKAQKAALKGLKKLLSSEDSPYMLRPDALSKLLDVGCRLERLNRDVPEQNVELLQQTSFDNLTTEEMDMLHRLLNKAEGSS